VHVERGVAKKTENDVVMRRKSEEITKIKTEKKVGVAPCGGGREGPKRVGGVKPICLLGT